MNRGSHMLQSLWPRKHSLAQEPGGEMFAHLRRKLTFWYSAVLAGMLVLSGAVLYFSVYHSLMDPVQNALMSRADQVREHWQLYTDQPYGGQPPNGGGPTFSNGQVYLTACYAPNGAYILNIYTSNNLNGAFAKSMIEWEKPT